MNQHIHSSPDQPCPVCGGRVSKTRRAGTGDFPCLVCGHLQWFKLEFLDQRIILSLLANTNIEYADFETVGTALIRQHRVLGLAIDMTHIQYVGSTFIGRLVALHRQLEAAGGKLVLCNMNPVVYEVFQITKLQNFFHFAADRNEALEALTQANT